MIITRRPIWAVRFVCEVVETAAAEAVMRVDTVIILMILTPFIIIRKTRRI